MNLMKRGKKEIRVVVQWKLALFLARSEKLVMPAYLC